MYAQNRFVATSAWDPSAPEGQRGAKRAWTSRPGGWWKNALKSLANPINTSVMVKGDRLYALCEGGKPAELDPVTLETLGESDLGGIQAFYSAHPTTDAATGETFNIGIGGPKGTLELTRLSSDGTLEKRASFTPPANYFWHDNTVTEEYVIGVTSPFVAPLTSILGAILGFGQLGNAFKWDNSVKSEVPMLHSAHTVSLFFFFFAVVLMARRPLCSQAYSQESLRANVLVLSRPPPFLRPFLNRTGVFLLQGHIGVGKASGTSWLAFVLPHRQRLPRGGGRRHGDRGDRKAPRWGPREARGHVQRPDEEQARRRERAPKRCVWLEDDLLAPGVALHVCGRGVVRTERGLDGSLVVSIVRCLVFSWCDSHVGRGKQRYFR